MHAGDESARAELLEALYAHLHARAQKAMRNQPAEHTLQPTALVNEAYLRLLGKKDDDSGDGWNDRQHFLAVASRAMRQILVDHARTKARDKRTAGGSRIPLDDIVHAYEEQAVDLSSLNDALTRLAKFDPTMAQAVELRFFGGMCAEEVSRFLGLSFRTFQRRWQATRAWLLAEVR